MFLRLLILTIVLISCNKNENDKSDINSASIIEANDKFTLLESVTGKQLKERLSQYNGKKAVVVNYWATWCKPCVAEFPELVKIRDKYQDSLELIFVSLDFEHQKAEVVNFLKKNNVTWKSYFKSGSDEEFLKYTPSEFEGAIPFTMIYNKEGVLTKTLLGQHSFEDFDQAIQLVL